MTRGVEGPRAPALAGFEADNKAAGFSGLDKGPGDDRLTARLPAYTFADYSVELWLYNSRDLKQPNAPPISGYFYSRPGDANADNDLPGDHLGIGGVDSSPRDKLFYYDGQTLISGRTKLAINTWYHVTLVRTKDQVTVYLNGDVANPEIQAAVPRSFHSDEITLGTRSDGYAPFQGRLDEVAVFDVPLSAEQVQAHFAAASGMTPARDAVLKDNPIGYWRLDETEGALAASSATPHKRLVFLRFKNVPPGVAWPSQVVLVDGQTQYDFELSGDGKVAPVKVENIVVSATTPARGGKFTAESAPVALEVIKP